MKIIVNAVGDGKLKKLLLEQYQIHFHFTTCKRKKTTDHATTVAHYLPRIEVNQNLPRFSSQTKAELRSDCKQKSLKIQQRDHREHDMRRSKYMQSYRI